MNLPDQKDREAFDAFLEYGLSNHYPLVKNWITVDDFKSNLAQELEIDANKMVHDQIESQKEFKDIDYRTHIVEISGTKLLTAIRFLGIEKPYVEILRQDKIISDKESVLGLLNGIKEKFEHIKPEMIHIFEPIDVELAYENKAEDIFFFAAPLRIIKEKYIESKDNKIELMKSTNLDFFQAYDAIYQQVHHTRPWLMDATQQESHKKLQRSLDEGLLFEIFIDEKWAGVMATNKTIRFGLKGYAVREFILAEEFRNRGFTAPLQKLLAEKLEDDGNYCLLGTIGVKNESGIRAAESIGRIKLGTFYWLRF